MYIQLYTRLYQYIEEYQKLIYDIYSKHVVAFLTTYYNIDKEETIWEDEKVFSGSYHVISNDLSGLRWKKILLLPVYYMEEVSNAFDAQDRGYIKENSSSLVIPSTYGITPYPGDMIKFEQSFLRPTNDIYPLYQVGGAEITVNADRRFWKLKITNFQSRTTTELDNQVTDLLAFSEYDKKIHLVDDYEFLTRILYKNELLRENMKSLYDNNSGFYFI